MASVFRRPMKNQEPPQPSVAVRVFVGQREPFTGSRLIVGRGRQRAVLPIPIITFVVALGAFADLDIGIMSSTPSSMEDPHFTTASCLAKREMAAATLLGVREGNLLLGNSSRNEIGENPNRRSNAMKRGHETWLPAVSASSNSLSQSQSQSQSNSFVSMSSIGFGVAPDATEACQRAIDDSMSRTSLQLSGQPQLHVKLGVPAPVETSKLQLPPVASLAVVPGGLMAESSVAVVACFTLKHGPINEHESETSLNGATVPLAKPSDAALLTTLSSSSITNQPRHSVSSATVVVPAPATTVTSGIVESTPVTNSMEVLAMISEEIANASAQRSQELTASTAKKPLYTEAPPISASDGSTDEQRNNYNYQKLPPGLTMKNNRRLFVKHTYRDYSGEAPTPDEESLLTNTITPNAAFPLKLHDILTQIELAGLSDIIGWLPHGRSFKIHHQQEFAALILPKYFVMTKKSSFLRQLNLYGFNRLCGGPDQGSYYHEKFLRGMKFLCKRMNRQKVNGNRIRSAGNPDEEPVLSSYPSCPPPRGPPVGV